MRTLVLVESLLAPGLGQLLQRRVETALMHLYVGVLLWVIFIGVTIAGRDLLWGILFPLLLHIWSVLDAIMWREKVRCRTR